MARPRGSAAPSSARQAAFDKIRQDLGGVWLGSKGETYEVVLDDVDCSSTTWTCVRRNEFGNVPYTLKWDGEDSVVWGQDYCLLLSELRRAPNRPTWHSAKGKRPFVWMKPGTTAEPASRQQLPPAQHAHQPPAAQQPPSHAQAPSVRVHHGNPSAQPKPATSGPGNAWNGLPWSERAEVAKLREEKEKAAAIAAVATTANAEQSPCTSSAVESEGCGEVSPKEDPVAAGAAAAALLRRLAGSVIVPPELAEEVASAAASAAGGTSQAQASQAGGERQAPSQAPSEGGKQQEATEACSSADWHGGGGGMQGKIRPPPPSMSPKDAEQTVFDLSGLGLNQREFRPAPIGVDTTIGAPRTVGADDTDGDENPNLPLGAQVRALFYGEWHDGTIRGVRGNTVEILWDSEYTMSYVPASDVELKSTESKFLDKLDTNASVCTDPAGLAGKSLTEALRKFQVPGSN